jgi:hypothetical protein
VDANQKLIERSTCSALIITCSDFRFKTVEREIAVRAGVTDDYDLIARPGAIRSLVQPRSEAARTTLEDEMRLLWGVHAFTRVIMLHHVSCRAYDDLTAVDDEIAVHQRHLAAAIPIVEAMLPGVTAEPFVVESADSVVGPRAMRSLRPGAT